MVITSEQFNRFQKALKAINNAAYNEMKSFLDSVPYQSLEMDDIINLGYYLSTKFGEASAALACQMCDDMAEQMGATVPLAEPSETASYEEVKDAIYASLKYSPWGNNIPGVVSAKVKQAGQDTLVNYAKENNGLVAWVNVGRTCPYCMYLASRGWVNASDEMMEGKHVTHIHDHCDCTYMINPNWNDSYVEIEGQEKNQELYQSILGENSSELNTYAKIKRFKDYVKSHTTDAERQKRNEQHRLAYGHLKEQKGEEYTPRGAYDVDNSEDK